MLFWLLLLLSEYSFPSLDLSQDKKKSDAFLGDYSEKMILTCCDHKK